MQEVKYFDDNGDVSMEREYSKAAEMREKFSKQMRGVRARSGNQVVSVLRTKIGRNDPCPCGSGKKFKKCCLG